MNESLMSRLTLWGMIMIGVLLLAGCRADPVTPVEAASPNSALSEEARAEIHPADRKFFDEGYAAAPGFARELRLRATIHPADRKFFDPTYCWTTPGCAVGAAVGLAGMADPSDPLAHLHPADRKFFDPTYCWTTPGCAVGASVAISGTESLSDSLADCDAVTDEQC